MLASSEDPSLFLLGIPTRLERDPSDSPNDSAYSLGSWAPESRWPADVRALYEVSYIAGLYSLVGPGLKSVENTYYSVACP